MYEVNRSVAIIHPQAPFWTWLQQLPGGLEPAIQLAQQHHQANTLLIPACDEAAQGQDFVLSHYAQIFATELADWCDDEQLWPKPLSIELFMQWFRVDIHPIVSDWAEEALQRADFEPIQLF